MTTLATITVLALVGSVAMSHLPRWLPKYPVGSDVILTDETGGHWLAIYLGRRAAVRYHRIRLEPVPGSWWGQARRGEEITVLGSEIRRGR